MSDPTNELVDGLWARLRNVLIALDRIDRLDSATDFVGWVEAFQRDDAQIETTTRDWLLRALRVACDPLNYQVLRALEKSDGQSIAALMRATNLARVELTERVKELAQTGFVAQDLETETVQATRAAAGIVAWIESLRAQIAARAQAGLTKDNPVPIISARRFSKEGKP
ncbi:MAG: hypothetical protein HY868_02780 [Chloroflexi bacterium]|nr:hypothetical protein [Chloroflexota bacterium]